MNGLKCPECGLVNLLTAEKCHRCGNGLSDLGTDAQVSVPVDETFSARGFSDKAPIDTEVGRKTFFWYRIYCGFMSALYLLVSGLGAFLVIFALMNPENVESTEQLITGAIYLAVGVVLLIVFALGLLLPRKPYHWIYGIVLIALGLTSCCLWPATIPLLIFWIKSETQAYLGRT